jgi:hypothetical protein
MFDLFPAFTKITREGLNSIPRAVLSMIRPGPGISIFPTGDGGICISTQQGQGMQQGGMAGGGGSGTGCYLGLFSVLNADGNTMEVYLWDSATEAWALTTTTVYKPIEFQAQFWEGETVIGSDGSSITYTTTGLDKKYQRRATWIVDEVNYTEVQEITGPYGVQVSRLYIKVDPLGNLVDENNAGRHWGVNEDYT